MEKKKPSTVKWVCGTILVIFFVGWITAIMLPFGLLAVVSTSIKDMLGHPRKTENIIINKSKPPISYSVKSSNKQKDVPRYTYIIDLKSGGNIRASRIKKKGNSYSIINKSGLKMVIQEIDVKNIKKVRL